MKALFICDDKKQWEYFHNLFAAHFAKIELICVIDGTDAVEYLSYEGPFAMIIIDAEIKCDDPSELASKFINIAGEKPTIFLGSKAIIQDRVHDHLHKNHEFNDILHKPIDIPKFRKVINQCISWAKQEEFEQSVQELDKEDILPMKLRNFYLFDSIPYDVYIELTTTKFAKIISANKKYSHSEIQVYAKKGVKDLYLYKNEYLKFLEEGIEKLLTIFKTWQKLSTRKIVANQVRAILLIHQYVRTVGVSESLLELTGIVIEVTRHTFKKEKKYKNILSHLSAENLDLAEQAVATIYLCEGILVGLGWASDMSRKKLGLASILYDSMLSNDDLAKIRSLEDPDLQLFSTSEQEEFAQHPLKAAEIAQFFQGYPDTDFIIAQHHERPKGDGFPSKLTANKMTAHSCAFIIANNFVCRLKHENANPGSLLNIFREIKTTYNVGNFKEPLAALQKTII